MTALPWVPPWDGGPDIEVPDRRYDDYQIPSFPPGWRYDDRKFWNLPPDFYEEAY
jgi:hypothetical protein